jgi:hypothetical protein
VLVDRDGLDLWRDRDLDLDAAGAQDAVGAEQAEAQHQSQGQAGQLHVTASTPLDILECGRQ